MKGRPKKIETPEKMWEYFQAYRKEVKSNPFLVKDWVGKDAIAVYREKEKPLTIEGFENWCSSNEIIEDLGDYFTNTKNNYNNYSAICSRIKKNIRNDQIAGGMAGIYNPSITQRLNGLVEKSEVTTKQEQPLFGD
jgi:DNA-packaging protein gp3